MKYSLNWLKELVAFSWDTPTLSEKLADLGFPVESIALTGVSIPGVVSAKILSVDKHPNADRLSVTQVDDGSGAQTVVCGATNIAAGQIVPLAKPGASLPNGITIAVAKIRGVESHGMLCSERELNLSGSHEGILQLPKNSPLGVSLDKIFGSDTLIDLEIPPNRPDVLSHVGLARELSAVSGKPIRLPLSKWKAEADGPVCSIEIKDSSRCSRYMGKIIRGVKIGPSPDWLAKRLESCGIRPINNVVDITNYVLLEWGHPLHAFDLAKLRGPKIVVRLASPGEKIEALDGKTFSLTTDDLVIADAEKPVAIAGIMGGQTSGVTESTVDILLESAVFDATTVRRTSRRLGLKSESSLRFEKGTNFETAEQASLRAAALIQELAGGQTGRASDVIKKRPTARKLSVSLSGINRLVGSTYKKETVQTVLKKLNYGLVSKKDGWNLTVPAYRRDIEHPADVVEDVLRSLGYATIPSSTIQGAVSAPSGVGEHYSFHEDLRERLKGWGVSEALTSTLVNSGFMDKFGFSKNELVALANPLSQEESALRPLLLPKLLEAAQRNVNNQWDSLKLFEIGDRHRWHDNQLSEGKVLAAVLVGADSPSDWSSKPNRVDFYSVKGLVEGLFESLGLRSQFNFESGPAFLHPQQKFEISLRGKVVGWAGLLHPSLASELDLPEACAVLEIETETLSPTRPVFTSYSRHPFVERDLAVLLDKRTSWATVADVVRRAAGPFLKSMNPFDLFTGANVDASKKSLAFRIRLQADDRTLSESEIISVVERIKSALSERCGAQLR